MPRLSKKAVVDKQFEAFLKESLSTDDSMDKYFTSDHKAKEDEAEPWWLKGDDSTDSSSLKNLGTGKSFLKQSGPTDTKKPYSASTESPRQKMSNGPTSPYRPHKDDEKGGSSSGRMLESWEEKDETDDKSISQLPQRSPRYHMNGSTPHEDNNELKLALPVTNSSLDDVDSAAPPKPISLQGVQDPMGTLAGNWSGLSSMSSGGHLSNTDNQRTGVEGFGGPSTFEFGGDATVSQYHTSGRKTGGMEETTDLCGPGDQMRLGSHRSGLEGLEEETSQVGSLRHESKYRGGDSPDRGTGRVYQQGAASSMLSKVSLHDSCDDTPTLMGGMTGQGGGGDTQDSIPGLPRQQGGTPGSKTGSQGLDSHQQITLGGGVGGDTSAADISAIHAAYAALDGTATAALGVTLSSGNMGPLQGVEESVGEGRGDMTSMYTTQSFGMRVLAPSTQHQNQDSHFRHQGHTQIDPRLTPPPIPTPRNNNKTDANRHGASSVHRENLSQYTNSPAEHKVAPSAGRSTSTTHSRQPVLHTTHVIQQHNSRHQPSTKQHAPQQHNPRYREVKSSGYGRKSTTPPPTHPPEERGSRRAARPNSAVIQGANRSRVTRSPVSRSAERQPVQSNDSLIHNRHTGNRAWEQRSSSGLGHSGSRDQSRGEGAGEIQLINQVREWQDKWTEEKRQLSKAKSEMMIVDREHAKEMQMIKTEHDQAVFKLQSEITKLKTRLEERVTLFDHKLPHDISKEDIARLEKGMVEQETLLSGYQKENERLYAEMKKVQLTSKQTEKEVFEENHRLTQEVISLKDELERKELEIKSRGFRTAAFNSGGNAHHDGACRDTVARHQLETDLRALRTEMEELKHKMRQMEIAKNYAEATVDRLTHECSQLASKEEKVREVNTTEAEKVKEGHQEEVEQLKRKLRWYVENQALLTRDATKIKEKNNQIKELQSQLEKSRTIQISESVRSRERLAESRKIKALEAQVTDLQTRIHGGKMVAGNEVERYLESRVKALEGQLEERREDGEKALRSLEQQYYAMKTQYEDQIASLERELAGKAPESETRLAVALAELDKLSDQLKIKDKTIDKLRREMKLSKSKTQILTRPASPSRKPGVSGSLNANAKLESLAKQVRERDAEIKHLHLLLDKKEERDQMTPRDGADLMAECQRLRHELSSARLEADQYRSMCDSLHSNRDSTEERIRREVEEKLGSERAKMKEEWNRAKVDFAQKHAQSKVAELQSKTETQEVVINHLKEQLARNAVDFRSLEVCRQSERQTRERAETLASELAEVRGNQNPTGRQFDQLRAKVMALEEKQRQRDANLDSYIEKQVSSGMADAEKEAAKWRRLMEEKNRSLTVVRAELDRLVEALEELQRQGILIPIQVEKLASVGQRLAPGASK